ncbi:uncharacterized protein PG986_014619 [Apiospora aurea]|uniref:Uncharacterized protein n=1 Tax=Apiospora aurea TaxID=335848 RepID=A0ABR1PTJ0_9PEZI
MKFTAFNAVLCLSLVAGTLASTQGNPSDLNAAKDHKRVVAARQVTAAKDHNPTVAARIPVAKDHKHTEAARAPVAKDHTPVHAAQEPTFVTLVARPKDHKHYQAAVVSYFPVLFLLLSSRPQYSLLSVP